MLQKKYIGIVLLLLVAVSASAQKAERDYIRKGNRFFKDSVYVDAEVNDHEAQTYYNKQSQCLIWGIHWLSRINCKRLWNNMLPLQK